MEKISVIVCAYNRQAYLQKCIESIMKSDYPNLEIIVINDGSTDGTAQILETLNQADSRIRLMHKRKNEGVGAARNDGLDMAIGDYILFVDSDDWIDSNHISDLYDLLQRTESDVAVCNFSRFYQETGSFQVQITDADYYESVYSPQEWFKFQYGHPNNLSLCFTVPWVKLYRKSLFDHVRYPEGVWGDDDRTTWKLYLLCNRIAYMNRSSLVYRVNESSMTSTADQATIFHLEPVIERIKVLSLIGFDLSRELAAYRWRHRVHLQSSLAKGDMVTYQDLLYQKTLIEKYGK